jgi:hypothetical protein
MTYYRTKLYSTLPDDDEMRSSGPPADILIIQNLSQTIELEAVVADVEMFQNESGKEIDSDTIDDDLMSNLIEFLNLHRLLDVPV